MASNLYSEAMDVSVTELRANLAAFLDKVQAGDEITITDRGQPIARIVPAGWAQRLRELEAKGVITMPVSPVKSKISHQGLPRMTGSANDLRDEWR